MLRWSAETTGRPIDVRAVAEPGVDPRVPGGRELVALARAAVTIAADGRALERLAEVLGEPAAVDAACVAAAFEGFNRIVDATGLPMTRARRAELAEVIEVLGLDRFPHA